VLQSGAYTYTTFSASYVSGRGVVLSTVQIAGYKGNNANTQLTSIEVLGVPTAPKTVTVNGSNVTTYTYNSSTQDLVVSGLNLAVDKAFSLNWQ
jgi:hypothetical protein